MGKNSLLYGGVASLALSVGSVASGNDTGRGIDIDIESEEFKLPPELLPLKDFLKEHGYNPRDLEERYRAIWNGSFENLALGFYSDISAKRYDMTDDNQRSNALFNLNVVFDVLDRKVNESRELWDFYEERAKSEQPGILWETFD